MYSMQTKRLQEIHDFKSHCFLLKCSQISFDHQLYLSQCISSKLRQIFFFSKDENTLLILEKVGFWGKNNSLQTIILFFSDK